MSKYQVSANGQTFGIYEADSAEAALDLCAQDAGYKSVEEMEQQLERSSELEADDLSRYATDWNAWCEYIDPDATTTREQWDAMSSAEKIALVVEMINASSN